jgi:HPt (histidine-containing phosphotransfer) domain-containing protein
MAKPVGLQTMGACLQRWLPHVVMTADAAPDASAGIGPERLPQLQQPPALDLDVLHGLTGDDPAEVRALLADFLASTDDDLAQLEALRVAGDLPGLTRQAHKIKGAARLVGAVELAEAAARLETAGRDVAWDRVLPAAADVHTALLRLRLDVAGRWPGG